MGLTLWATIVVFGKRNSQLSYQQYVTAKRRGASYGDIDCVHYAPKYNNIFRFMNISSAKEDWGVVDDDKKVIYFNMAVGTRGENQPYFF